MIPRYSRPEMVALWTAPARFRRWRDDKDPAEIRYMMGRWRHDIDHDPFYSPHLSRRDGEFRIKTEVDEEPFLYYKAYR